MIRRVGRSRRGFSALELGLASGLFALLAMLVAAAWSGFGAPIRSVYARCTLAREAELSLATLTHDLDGVLDRPVTQDQPPYGLVGRIPSASAPSWRMVANPSPLQLCFDGGTTPDGQADWAGEGGVDTVVSYAVQGDTLLRIVEPGGGTFVVARKVEGLAVTPIDNHGNVDPLGRWVRIDLTLRDRDLKQTYSLVAYGP